MTVDLNCLEMINNVSDLFVKDQIIHKQHRLELERQTLQADPSDRPFRQTTKEMSDSDSVSPYKAIRECNSDLFVLLNEKTNRVFLNRTSKRSELYQRPRRA